MRRKITEGTKTFSECALTCVASKKQLDRETHVHKSLKKCRQTIEEVDS